MIQNKRKKTEAGKSTTPMTWTHSYIKSTTLSHGWMLDNFSLYGEEKLTSTNFSTERLDLQDQWCLELYSNIDNNLKIVLKLVSLNEYLSIAIRCKPTILDTMNENSLFKESITLSNVKKTVKTENNCFFEIPRSTLFESPERYLPDDTLTVFFTIVIAETFTLDLSRSIQIPPSELARDLAVALKNTKFGDFTFIIGKKKFKAYKDILAARSPVFAAMFERNTKDGKIKNEMTILDIEENVFMEFLHFIYTDEAPNLSEMPMELLAAAEKYQMKRLKALCEKALADIITIENGAHMFLIADSHDSLQLTKTLITYFKNHYLSEFFVSEGFIALRKSNEPLTAKILKSLLS